MHKFLALQAPRCDGLFKIIRMTSLISKVGVGITSGLGVKGGLNPRDRNVAGSVLTPVWSFGVHAGCKIKFAFLAV